MGSTQVCVATLISASQPAWGKGAGGDPWCEIVGYGRKYVFGLSTEHLGALLCCCGDLGTAPQAGGCLSGGEPCG